MSAIVGLRHHCRFEGQAAMDLEFAVRNGVGAGYEFALVGEPGAPGGVVVDWRPLILRVLEDQRGCVPLGDIAARFHNALARLVVRVARLLGEDRVVLAGGCFQNVQLLRRAIRALREAGLRPYWHQRIPPNDGGIALGQVVAAARSFMEPARPTPPRGNPGGRHVPRHSG